MYKRQVFGLASRPAPPETVSGDACRQFCDSAGRAQMPVSYTHLKALVGGAANFAGVVIPVSYTHLDVYKRQEQSGPPGVQVQRQQVQRCTAFLPCVFQAQCHVDQPGSAFGGKPDVYKRQ